VIHLPLHEKNQNKKSGAFISNDEEKTANFVLYFFLFLFGSFSAKPKPTSVQRQSHETTVFVNN
jgi:hypothetical protein